VVATALLDQLLHHAIFVQVEGVSYLLRQHADLLPQHTRSNAPRRRGRPPRSGTQLRPFQDNRMRPGARPQSPAPRDGVQADEREAG